MKLEFEIIRCVNGFVVIHDGKYHIAEYESRLVNKINEIVNEALEAETAMAKAKE